ncbi:MAG: DNA polymerase IV, partial [Hyphomicrobiales bacterium]|nr:DNA polymerase IV [Hyphomicrobiales bacterium]
MGLSALALCRDCFAEAPAARCPRCGSPRLLRHDERDRLTIAHVDCDAFYASVEKRDDPSLRDKPVIVGGARRGVVSTCCYLARVHGVRSAMPMFEARRLCPQAIVVKPDMAKYVAVSRQIRALMRALTPLVEPISIDEAFLDLSGTERLHGASPDVVLARFAARVEAEIGVSVSIGLSYCKFLAKVASDLSKPRGFSVIGRAEANAFLADKRPNLIPGVGPAAARRLAAAGIATIGDLQTIEPDAAFALLGPEGPRLCALAQGVDARPVRVARETKSVSSETTFNDDVAEPGALETRLLALCERVAARLRAQGLATRGVTLKLKTADFKSRTRAVSGLAPTRLAGRLFAAAKPLLAK